MEQKSDRSGFTPENIIYTPENIVSFISKIVSHWNPETVLDPACGSASFFPKINSVLKSDPKFIGVDIGKNIIEMAEENLKGSDIKYELYNNDFFSFKENFNEKFDLIVSQPSFVQLQEVKELNGFNVLDLEIGFLVGGMDLLENAGRLVLIIPEQKSFFYSEYYYPLRMQLMEKYSLEAIISLPNHTLYPFSSIKTGIVIFKNAKQRDNVFFAKYSNKDDDAIIENFLETKFNDNPSQGFWVDSSILREENVYWTYGFLRTLNESHKRMEESKYLLKRFSDVAQFKKRVFHEDKLLLFPKTPYEDVILYSELDDEDDLENYFPFIVTDPNVSMYFLKIYLNSSPIKNLIGFMSFGSVNKELDRKAINSFFVEVPELETQNKVVDTCHRLDKLYSEIDSVYHNFKRHIFDYNDLNETLEKYSPSKEYPNQIWPFATSYHMVAKSGDDCSTRLDNIFSLSEMIAAFNSIVLLSALPEEICSQYKDRLWDNKTCSYTKMSFGGWISVYRLLSEIYRELDSEIYRVLPFEKEFYDNLSNDQIIRSLGPISEERNKKAHGGPKPRICTEKSFFELNTYLNNIFNSLMDYERLKLIYTSSLDKRGGLYTIKSKLLRGLTYPFAEYKFEAELDMDTKTLYLYDSITENRLRLLPEFIKFMECPKCGKWALFFYNKVEDNHVKYVSYQDEVHSYLDQDKGILKLFE